MKTTRIINNVFLVARLDEAEFRLPNRIAGNKPEIARDWTLACFAVQKTDEDKFKLWKKSPFFPLNGAFFNIGIPLADTPS